MLFLVLSFALLHAGAVLVPSPEPAAESLEPSPALDLNPDELEPGFLNPTGSAACPSKCRYYFAGAASSDSVVCQKQASGVGSAQQNRQLGVACYPAYGCGKDMITCVNQAWTGPLPKFTDAALACAGLTSVTTENPWECGSADEGRLPCAGNQNNNVGKWRKATANLDCGWGSTYGKTYPGYSGDGTPATVIFTGIDSDFECCLKAMEFEGSSWDEGGAATFFQQGRNINGQTGSYCRVDREKIIFGNLDSSSGRSIKHQDTRCGDNHFFYRHAAGAADAANLHTGGRCVVDGGFQRAPLTSGTNLPGGELPDGWELPNQVCTSAQCSTTIKFNTINDAEECCRMCTTLSWLSPNKPNEGGDASTSSDGTHVNPCVTWQIVEGRCRIARKSYFDKYNPGQSILDAIIDSDYQAPGNTDWVIPTRGCGTSMEACNYYSWIYYREFGTPSNTSNGTANYRKILRQNITDGDAGINITFSVSSLSSRRDMRIGLMPTDAGAERTSTVSVGEDLGGTDCGMIEVFDAAEALTSSRGYDVFNDEQYVAPLCNSTCISSGTARLECKLADVNFTGRRLGEMLKSFAVSFTSAGSGYDLVDFTATRDRKVLSVSGVIDESSTTTAEDTFESSTTPYGETLLSSTEASTVTPAITASTTTSQSLTESSKNITQTIVMTNLTTFSGVDALAASYKSAIASAGNIPESKVSVEIVKITVKVTLQFSGTVPSVLAMKQAIAQAAGIPENAISIVTSRRLEYVEKSQGSRRLNTAYVAEIDASESASTSGDIVETANQIHSSLQNKTVLEAAFTQKDGGDIMLSSTSLAFKIDAKAIVQTTASADTLADSTFADAVGLAIGGDVTTLVVDHVSVTTSTTAGASMVTSTPDYVNSNKGNSARSLACFFVTSLTLVATLMHDIQR